MRLAIDQPDLIDRMELTRMRLVYEDTAQQVDMCREQLKRWCGECTTPEQVKALERLAGIVKQWADDTRLVRDAIDTLLHEG
ncbi:hypothetical protein [Dyella psychrodurans]|nr:hypothetical protein [Dyella psychrodurans]